MLLLTSGMAQGGVSGEWVLGWRAVDVDGDRSKYRENLNLRDGMWLPALNVDWRDPEAERRPEGWRPDTLELQLSNVGDEPYKHARLQIGRLGHYRLRYDRSESEYFYDDVLIRPEEASLRGSTGGDFRRFDFERVRDRLTLDADLSERTTLLVGYERQRKRGDGTAPIYVSREQFEVARPIDETLDTIEARVSHAREDFSVAFTERYRRFDFESSMFLPTFSLGLDPDAPTTLDVFMLDQPYTQEGFEHDLRARYRATPRLTFTGNLLLADLDVSLRTREVVGGTDYNGAPFETDLQGAGDMEQDRRLADVGLTYAASDRLELFVRVRGMTLEQSADLLAAPTGATDWDIDGRRFETGAETVLGRTVRVALGAVADARQVVGRQTEHGTAEVMKRNSDADGYFLRLWYRPTSRAELHMAYENGSVDDPFSLAMPTATTRYRVRGRYRWENGVSVSASYLDTERRNGRSGWHMDAERFDLRAAYSGQRLTVSTGLGRTDVSRSVDSMVIADLNDVSFDIDYLARADTFDVEVNWRFPKDLNLGGSFRRYDNGRSFEVDRDDWRVFLRGRIDERYLWGVDYRWADLHEGGIEDFDARVLELSLGLRW